MRTKNNFVLMLGFVLVFMIATNAASAPTLTFKFTTVNVPGAIATVLGGINDAGVIVGQYEDKKDVVHCFMLAGSKVTTINHPNAVSDGCIHINSAESVAFHVAQFRITVQRRFCQGDSRNL